MSGADGLAQKISAIITADGDTCSYKRLLDQWCPFVCVCSFPVFLGEGSCEPLMITSGTRKVMHGRCDSRAVSRVFEWCVQIRSMEGCTSMVGIFSNSDWCACRCDAGGPSAVVDEEVAGGKFVANDVFIMNEIFVFEAHIQRWEIHYWTHRALLHICCIGYRVLFEFERFLAVFIWHGMIVR